MTTITTVTVTATPTDDAGEQAEVASQHGASPSDTQEPHRWAYYERQLSADETAPVDMANPDSARGHRA